MDSLPPDEPFKRSEWAAGAATGLELGGGGSLASISTSTYDTGKMPLRPPILPSNQLSSTLRVITTSSPFASESSRWVWATKLYLARAWPSWDLRGVVLAVSYVTIWKKIRKKNLEGRRYY